MSLRNDCYSLFIRINRIMYVLHASCSLVPLPKKLTQIKVGKVVGIDLRNLYQYLFLT